MELIKKFKNGNLVLKSPSLYGAEIVNNNYCIDTYYDDDMNMHDLYFNQINGYMYLVDFNKSLVYELGSYLLQNPLKYIKDLLEENSQIKLYPLSKKECKSLLQDLENGY